jgi:integrase/recombinase XerD
MTPLRQAFEEYLTMRRSLGYRYQHAEIRLDKFVAFLEKKRASHVTTALALEWSLQSAPALAEPANRMTIIRGFARYLSALDDRNEIPPRDLMPKKLRRVRPYLLSSEQVTSLLNAARSRRSSERPKGKYYCLFGLLAITGMRIGEALNLTDNDVDLVEGMIHVKWSKFGKSRLIPLHPTAVVALDAYKQRRNKSLGSRMAARFFSSSIGTPLRHSTIYDVLRKVCEKAGLKKGPAGRSLRPHDLRHRFAMETLTRWYRDGKDAERLLPILSTFLGHTRVEDTYWYLTEQPELMSLAVERMNRRWENRGNGHES